MDFNTLLFIAYFAAVAVLYYALPRFCKPVLLLLASYGFYLYKPQNAALVFVLAGLTLYTWILGFAIGVSKKKFFRILFLVLAVTGSIGCLVYFKYSRFLCSLLGLAYFQNTTDLIVPLGLSYFALSSLSYCIDIFNGKRGIEKNPLYYAVFVSFFPCIFTGPIERSDHFISQIRYGIRFDYSRCAGGVFRMLWGYFKKLVIADNLALYVGTVLKAPELMNGPHLAAATLLFPLQLYMDFSACCDIAIGGGALFGFELLENFSSPLLARSFSDLWRRWHMSLTGWFRDYIYYPLGGSRKGAIFTYLNLIIVFALSGLWHGASIGYLYWGICCGLLQVLERISLPMLSAVSHSIPFYEKSALQTVWQILRTYLLFAFSLIFFISALYDMDLELYSEMIQTGWESFLPGFSSFICSLYEISFGKSVGLILVLSVPLVLAIEYCGKVNAWIRRQSWALRWPVYYALSIAILYFGAFGQSVFIYQQY